MFYKLKIVVQFGKVCNHLWNWLPISACSALWGIVDDAGQYGVVKKKQYQGDNNNPPLKVRADQILISGFYFFQKSQQSQNGVLFFSEISAISVFFSENLTNFFSHFLDPFGPIFYRFPPEKRLKYPFFFSRASRAVYFLFFPVSQIRVLFFSEISAISDSGFYFFQKSHQWLRRGGVILSPW